MKKQVRDMTINAALCAIIAILTFVPYIGYIPLGFTSVTVIHVVVIIGAILLGPKHGFVLGTFFGLSSLIRSQTGTAADVVFMWPWVSVIPRAAFGFATGWLAIFFRKVIKNKSLAICVTAILATIVHTLLVFVMYFPTFCFIQGVSPFNSMSGNGIWGISVTQPILLYCFLVFMSSCLLEAILAAIVSTPICRSLDQYIKDPAIVIQDEEVE